MRRYEDVRDADRRTSDDVIYSDLIVTFRKDGGRSFLGGALSRSREEGAILCHSDSCDGGSFPLRIVNDETILLDSGEGGHFTVSGGWPGPVIERRRGRQAFQADPRPD